MNVYDDEPYNMAKYISNVRLKYGDMELYKRFIFKGLEMENTLNRENQLLFMHYQELEKLVLEDMARAIRIDILTELESKK